MGRLSLREACRRMVYILDSGEKVNTEEISVRLRLSVKTTAGYLRGMPELVAKTSEGWVRL